MLSPYWGLKIALKTEVVTSTILSYVQKTFLEKNYLEISGESIEISFVFFETTIKGVTLKSRGKEIVNDTDVSFSFSPQDLVKRNLKVGNLILEGGSVNLDSLPAREAKSSSNDIEIPSLLDKLPFRNVDIKNTNVISEMRNSSIYLREANLKRLRKGHRSIKILGKKVKAGKQKIDQIDLFGELKGYELKVSGTILKGVSSFEIIKSNYNLKNNLGSLSFDLSALGKDLLEIIDKPKMMGSHLEVFCEGEVLFNNFKLESLKTSLNIESPNKSYLDLSTLSAFLAYKDGSLVLENLELTNFGKGKGELVGKFFYDFENNKIVEQAWLKFSNFEINTEQSMFSNNGVVPLHAVLSGSVGVDKEEHYSRIDIRGLALNSFGVGEKSSILKLVDFIINGSLESNDGTLFRPKLKIKSEKTKLLVSGDISSKKVQLYAKDVFLDLDEFKHFSGVGVSGESSGDILFLRDKDNELLEFDLKGRDLSVANYFLGDSEGDLLIDFKNNKLKVKNLNSDVKSSLLKVNADFDLKPGGAYKISGTSKNINSLAVRTILEGSLNDILKKFKSIDFRGHSSFSVNGNYSGDFDVGFKISGNYFKFGNELFDDFEINLKLDENEVALQPLVLRKEGGSVFTSGKFNFSKNDLSLRVSGEDLNIKRLNFIRNYFPNTKGRMTVSFQHEGTIEKGNGSFDFELKDFGNEDVTYKASSVKVNKRGSLLDVTGSIFDGQTRLSSFFDLTSKKKSRVDLKVDIPELDKVLSIYHPEMSEGKSVDSQVAFVVSSDFFLDNFDSLNLNLNISDLYLRRKKTDLYIQYPFNEISIINGKIKHGTLKLLGGDHFFNFYVEGKKLGKSKLFLESQLSADLFELLIPSTLGVNMAGDVFIFGNLSYARQLFLNYNIELKNAIFSSSVLNRGLSGIDVSLSGDSSSLFLESASANFGGGVLNAGGLAIFNSSGIKLDIDVDLFDIQSKLLSNSFVNFDFRGGVSGSSVPYNVSGALKLKKVEFFESVNDWVKLFNSKSSSSKNELIFRNNLVVESEKPIRVKNNLMDIYIDSKIKVKGNNISPKINGVLSIVPQDSKVFLKGNMFSVTDGTVRLRKSSSRPDPYFDINAETKIDNYNLKSSIIGDLKNLNINFMSDPPLAQEDIFSLLAIGVTLKKTRNLGANAINNVTSLGLGSFLLDQTGINNSLDETLGVKVSIAPEIINDETSLLEGKVNQGVNNAQARVRSATKIRLTKRISNSLDMSYSSTLGGSLDQRQEMNLNLKVDKNIMIQGVYQTQSSDNSENTDTTNSMGLDLIWKKTFK